MIDLSTLTAVNRAVNAQLVYASSAHWSPRSRYGDCKSFTMAKLAALLALGAEPSDLTVAVVTLPNGEQHAILEVNAPEGIEVLDSLNDRVEPASTVFARRYRLVYEMDPTTTYLMENDH